MLHVRRRTYINFMKWAAKLKMYVVTFLPGLVMRTIKKDTKLTLAS